VEAEAFGHLCPDADRGVERHHGFLKDHANDRSTQGAQSLGRECREVFAVEHNPPAGAAQARWKETEHGARRDRLAAAGFADDRQELTACDIE
jgi:hypothetical protein